MMKNPCYFILKALFILGIFKFLSWLFGHVGKIYFNVYLQISLTSKFMTSQPGFQTMAIYLLSTILQSKGNQTMIFGQLIKYNNRNIFLQKLYGNEARRLLQDPFIF